MAVLDQLTYGYCPIVKMEKTADGLMVYGQAAGTGLDMDLQAFDRAYLKTAVPDWFKYANVREQHSQIAAGVGKELIVDASGDSYMLKALIVDPVTIKKVETGVLKGFSPGVKRGKVIKSARAPNGLIVAGEMVEISLVDRPSDPKNMVSICKSAGGATLFPKERKMEWLTEDLYKSASATAIDVLDGEYESADQEVTKAVMTEVADLLIAEAMMLKSAAADGTLAEGAYDIGGLINATNALVGFVDPDADGYPGMTGDFREFVGKSATVDGTTEDLVKAAVADLTKSFEARLEAQDEEIKRLRAMPTVGGPVVIPPTQTPAQTLNKSARADAVDYLAKSRAPGLDPALAATYRKMHAAQLKGAAS